MLEFVILFHEMPDSSNRSSHWDLMLRDGESLLTWALDHEPTAGSTVLGRRLPNHDLKYLSYEGPIAGDRGQVTQVATGQFEWIERHKQESWHILLNFGNNTWEVKSDPADAVYSKFAFSSQVKATTDH